MRLELVFVQQALSDASSRSVSSFGVHHVNGRVVHQEAHECIHGVVADTQEAHFQRLSASAQFGNFEIARCRMEIVDGIGEEAVH